MIYLTTDDYKLKTHAYRIKNKKIKIPRKQKNNREENDLKSYMNSFNCRLSKIWDLLLDFQLFLRQSPSRFNPFVA